MACWRRSRGRALTGKRGLLDDDGCPLDNHRHARRCGVAWSAERFDLSQSLHARARFSSTEYGVLVVQKRSRLERQKELAAVGAGARIRHRKRSCHVVADSLVEFSGVLVTGATPARAEGIAALSHKTCDDAMEFDAVVESEAGEIERARRVHRGHVGQELDADLALVRDQLPDIRLVGIEGGQWRLGKPCLPVFALCGDVTFGDERVDRRHRRVRWRLLLRVRSVF